MRLALAALVLAAALVPAMLTVPEADACQPRSWICPLNGQWYTTCGGLVQVPPVVACAEDALRELTLP